MAPSFRDDFRRTFDWLNERTDVGVNFFGVEVSVVQIGDDGPRAPIFEVVARPNGWQKAVKGGASAPAAGTTGAVSPLNAKRQDFFGDVMGEVAARVPSIRQPARARGNWVSFASGPFGQWSLSAPSDNRARVEAYLDTQDQALNERLFDEFHAAEADWNTAVGQTLSWERLDGRRASRIAAYHDLDLDDETARAAAKIWAIDTLVRMYGALNEPLRTRAKELRAAATVQHDDAVAAAHDQGSGAAAIPQPVRPVPDAFSLEQ